MLNIKFLLFLPLLFIFAIAAQSVKTSESTFEGYGLGQNTFSTYQNYFTFPVKETGSFSNKEEEVPHEWEMYYPYNERYDSLYVTTTVYQPFAPMTDQTASGKYIDTTNAISHRWIAVSRDLQQLGFTFGTKVEISGTGRYDGVWEVQDLMNKRYSKRIDLLVDREITLGKWDNVKIKRIN